MIAAGQPKFRRRPTTRGLAVFSCGIGLFLQATHFGSNAVFILAFFCMALSLCAPILVWMSLTDLGVRALPAAALAEEAHVNLHFQLLGRLPRLAVVSVDTPIGTAGADPVDLYARILVVEGLKRGVFSLATSRVIATDIFGLFRVERDFSEQERASTEDLIVYPKPNWDQPAQSHAPAAISAQAGRNGEPAGLRPYRPGDLKRDVDWKASARSEGPLVREREAYSQSSGLIFDWKDLTSKDPEMRLRSLSAGVLQASRDGASFGLNLPGCKLAPKSGPAQLSKSLHLLAAFDRETV